MNKIVFGYTLTDCYSANANYKGRQKQYVVKINGVLNNLLIGYYVNQPADSDRWQTFQYVSTLTEDQYHALIKVSEHFQENFIKYADALNSQFYCDKAVVNNMTWNHRKQVLSIAQFYLKELSILCEPHNKRLKERTCRDLWKIVGHKETLKEFSKYIYLW